MSLSVLQKQQVWRYLKAAPASLFDETFYLNVQLETLQYSDDNIGTTYIPAIANVLNELETLETTKRTSRGSGNSGEGLREIDVDGQVSVQYDPNADGNLSGINKNFNDWLGELRYYMELDIEPIWSDKVGAVTAY